MNKYKLIDMSRWPRRELFASYQKYDCPLYSMTVKIHAKNLFSYAKKNKESAFLLSLYALLRACNAVPQIRQRILNGNAVEFEQIDALTAILATDDVFQHACCVYRSHFSDFKKEAALQVARAKAGQNFVLDGNQQDIISASCVPWYSFEAYSAPSFNFRQTIPILTWGKFMDGIIPLAVKFDHSFVDGVHLAHFFSVVEQGFAEPEKL